MLKILIIEDEKPALALLEKCWLKQSIILQLLEDVIALSRA